MTLPLRVILPASAIMLATTTTMLAEPGPLLPCENLKKMVMVPGPQREMSRYSPR